jgi:soluble lytic murein transglycosylase-like protein
VLATAAAVGAVATGTFTALLPTPGDTATTAAADTPLDLAAHTTEMTLQARYAPAAMSPVHVHVETAEAPVDGAAIADEHLALLGKADDIAKQIAERKAAEERERLERERIDKIIAEGGVDGWIAEALRVLELPQSYAPAIKKIIMEESGGNPKAINNWDSNARKGTPSQGLMQTIPSTFKAYVHPDYADEPITHPIANITAGVSYMIDRWGVETLASGGRTDAAGNYIGY